MMKRIFVLLLLYFLPFLSLAETIELETLVPGEVHYTSWEGRPVFVYKRTKSDIEELNIKPKRQINLEALSPAIEKVAMMSGNQRASTLLHYLLKVEEKPTRSIREDVLIVFGVSSRQGCAVNFSNELKLFSDQCSDEKYGLDGRLLEMGEKGAYHLLIPPHFYLNENVLILGTSPDEEIKQYDFSPNVLMMNGSNAEKLFHAVQWQQKLVALMLLRDKQVINHENDHRSTALHVAAVRGDAHLINEMINAGFDVNRINKSNVTPLLVALLGDHKENAAALIKRGANTEAFCYQDLCAMSSVDFMLSWKLASNIGEAQQYLADLGDLEEPGK